MTTYSKKSDVLKPIANERRTSNAGNNSTVNLLKGMPSTDSLLNMMKSKSDRKPKDIKSAAGSFANLTITKNDSAWSKYELKLTKYDASASTAVSRNVSPVNSKIGLNENRDRHKSIATLALSHAGLFNESRKESAACTPAGSRLGLNDPRARNTLAASATKAVTIPFDNAHFEALNLLKCTYGDASLEDFIILSSRAEFGYQHCLAVLDPERDRSISDGTKLYQVKSVSKKKIEKFQFLKNLHDFKSTASHIRYIFCASVLRIFQTENDVHIVSDWHNKTLQDAFNSNNVI